MSRKESRRSLRKRRKREPRRERKSRSREERNRKRKDRRRLLLPRLRLKNRNRSRRMSILKLTKKSHLRPDTKRRKRRLKSPRRMSKKSKKMWKNLLRRLRNRDLREARETKPVESHNTERRMLKRRPSLSLLKSLRLKKRLRIPSLSLKPMLMISLLRRLTLEPNRSQLQLLLRSPRALLRKREYHLSSRKRSPSLSLFKKSLFPL